jgi:putative addiction module killer protein
LVVVQEHAVFVRWLRKLADRQARAKILVTIQRMEQGHFGDTKHVGPGVMETRINTGPGYRLYYTRRGAVLVILLAGGDKSTQARDIARAVKTAAELKEAR